ncbi:molybdenum cofactor biosynthesis protein MoeA, partial [Streptomyces sp. NRRL F-6602]
STGDDRTAAPRPSARETAGTAWPPEAGPEPPGRATPPPARSGGAPRPHETPDGETPGQASAAAASHGQCGARPHGSSVTGWAEAVRVAGRAGQAVRERTSAVRPPLELPPAEALGLVLARPLAALTDLPPFDTSAMDGWA